MLLLRSFFLLVGWLGLPGLAQAYDWTGQQDEVPIGQSMQVWLDGGGRAGFAEVVSGPMAEAFTVSSSAKPFFGFRPHDALWIRVAITNATDAPAALILNYDQPILDSLDIYIMEQPGSALRHTATGDQYSFVQRPYYYRTFALPLQLEAGASAHVWMRAQTAGTLVAPLTLWSAPAFARFVVDEQLVFGLFYGTLLVMTLYNLFLFSALRDRSYLYYVGMLGSFALTQSSWDGLAFQYMWPSSPWWANQVLQLSIGVAGLFGNQFTRSFLGSARRAPRMDRVLQASMAIALVQILLLAFDRSLAIRMSVPVGLITIAACFVTGVVVWRGGYRPARFFLLAWTSFAAGVLLIDLKEWGILPNSLITQYGWRIGSAGEMLLLSLALADRINLIRQEKEVAQREALEAERRSLDIQRTMAQSFSRFVPKALLELLNIESIVDARLGDQVQRTMTIMFSDIRDFTSISEGMSPAENFEFINSYLSMAGPQVRDHNGFIDKYIGDGIMALFPSCEEDALRGAIALIYASREFSQQRVAAGLPGIRVGVGLHTGGLMLGVVGESERLEGTVISDAVNLASRLEGMTKTYGAQVLLSRATYEGIPPGSYSFRYLGPVMVKGKQQSTAVYECLDAELPEVQARREASRELFEQAVRQYEAGQGREARPLFAQILATDPTDKAAAWFAQQCDTK